MLLAIDATPLLLRSGGVKTYTYEWIRHLRRLAGGSQVLAFPSISRMREFSHERSALGLPATAARLAYVAAINYSGLPLLDWTGPRADVFHASHQCWNPPRRTRLTATLHDLTCWIAPEMHSPRNVAGLKLYAGRVVSRADGLIAVSGNTRADAVRILNVPEQKIEVIYPGVSDAFFTATPEDATAAAAKYGLSRPYVLFVGTIEPRKNVDALLDAWEQISPSLREAFDLVVAGPVGWADPRTVHRVRAGAHGARYLGYVPEPDLPGITKGAAVFVYPSLYEGFGFPVAQAMAAGVPVITSNVSSLPEVAGDAALLVDPRSVQELRDAIERLLLAPGKRTALASAGLDRARRFTWEACASASLKFFERICELPSPR